MSTLAADQDIDLSSPWTLAALLIPFVVIFIGWLTRKREQPKD